MTPKRISVKFAIQPGAGGSEVELEPFIPMFHRFIQDAAVEGLLIDVADYAHVPEGPGVLLVGHDVDYAVDTTGGQPGLLVVRKRLDAVELADAVRDTLRRAVGAMKAIEQNGAAGVRFAPEACSVRVIDRLAVPNTEEGFAAARAALAPVAEAIFGAGASLTREAGDDALQAATLEMRATSAVDLDTLMQRTGAVLASPRQSDWDLAVEELKKHRDEGTSIALIDVREQHEFEICNLGGQLMPLGSLADRLDELDRSAFTVVHCKGGGRGAQAVALLREAGFENAWNLRGGIIAWIDEVDPSLERY